MRIQHNIMALNSYRQLSGNNSALAKNLEKLSSGYRINRAGDDAAGLAISEKMRAQIKGLEAAQKNANDGISLVQTAEGALTEVHSMLNRMVYLATQSANGTYDDTVDRTNLDKEFQTLKEEIDRIAQATNFNGINLLDGSLSNKNLTVDGITNTTIDMANGVDITQGANGGGSKGEYTINVDEMFGTGDTLTIAFGGKAGAGTASLTLSYNTTVGAANAFSGNTKEEQAESIKEALKANSDVADNFDIEIVDGTTIKLTSKVEGNKITAGDDQTSTITSVVGSNVTAKLDATSKQTAGTASKLDGKFEVDTPFDKGNGTGLDLQNGDKLEFEVVLANGTTVKATLEAGKDFILGGDDPDAANAGTAEATLDSIAKALNEKAINFEDVKGSVLDESKIAFGDLFKVTTDSGTNLVFTVKSDLVDLGANTNLAINKIAKLDGSKTAVPAGDITATASGTPAAKASEYLLKLDATATSFTPGDKLTIGGKLADGRDFSFDVVAGKDFAIDSQSFANTMTNLETLLETKGMDITLSDGSTVSSKDIFGATKEIDFDPATGKFTSTVKGDKASQITKIGLTTGPDAAITEKLTNGAQKTSADSVIEFKEGLQYGAIVEVNGEKYEIVEDAANISGANNKAVVVSDLTDTKAVADAMAKALKDNLDDQTYSVSTAGSKVTVSTTEVGSNATAATVSSSGDKATQLEFTLDPAKFKSGSPVIINGQRYEFVEKGGQTTEKGATKIEIEDFSKETAKSLGDKLAAAANGVKNAQVLCDAEGKVTVRGMADREGRIETPTVQFGNSRGGLVMQIGDTADDYNKISVSIYDMHCADMGIGDTDIKHIDTAASAIDKIKAAINYVSDVRGDLGAIQNRLEHTINNLGVQTENITAAESRIRDTDMAEEMMAYTKNNILVQAAQAMLAQANQVPQGILQLLQ